MNLKPTLFSLSGIKLTLSNNKEESAPTIGAAILTAKEGAGKPKGTFNCLRIHFIKLALLNGTFDEKLTGLEDLDVAKRIIADGYKLSYEPNAGVFHIHQEKFRQIKNRFERESLALQKIMPEIHINLFDLIILIYSSVFADIIALDKKRLRTIVSIIAYRCLQYYGSYRGNHISRKLSKKAKYVYFYPK